MSRSSLLELVVALCICLADPASAQEPDEFQRHVQQAQTLYQAGSYEESIQELEEAYAIRPLPRLLFNIGNLQRKLGQNQAAEDSYMRYLRAEPDAPTEFKEQIRTFLASRRVPPQQERTARPPLSHTVDVTRTPQIAPRPVYKRWWFWTAIGTVAAAAVTAGVVASTYHPSPDVPSGLPTRDPQWLPR